jgi:nascent polypeptide-associated complex subunit alpha
MPELEETQPTAVADSAPQTTTDMLGNETVARQPGKQSRMEKKARKAMKNLGMKPVPGIHRVTVKKAKNILFVISEPDVLKSPASDTYIIFGLAKIEDLQSQNAAAAAEQFKAPDDLSGDVPDLVGAESDDEEVDETGLEEADIKAIMDTTGSSRSKAAKELRKANNVVIDAIMALS